MLNKTRAIVSDIPGTTRDYIEDGMLINNVAIKLIDTAGLRKTSDYVEAEGIKLVYDKISEANLVVFLRDITENTEQSLKLYNNIKEKYNDQTFLLVNNKSDLIKNSSFHDNNHNCINISAKNPTDIEKLKSVIWDIANNCVDKDEDILLNQRQFILLSNVLQAVNSAIDGLEKNMSNEFIAIDIKNAAENLGAVSGRQWNEEVLNSIFSKFYIGK